jgi:hypothetical protein
MVLVARRFHVRTIGKQKAGSLEMERVPEARFESEAVYMWTIRNATALEKKRLK